MGELPVRQGKCILLVGLVLVEPAQMKFQPPRGKFCVPGEQYITDTPCCVCNGEKRKRWCCSHALFSAKNRRSSTRVKGKLRRRFEVSKARGAHHRRVERHNAIERERGRFAAAWIEERGRGKSKARSVHLHYTHGAWGQIPAEKHGPPLQIRACMRTHAHAHGHTHTQQGQKAEKMGATPLSHNISSLWEHPNETSIQQVKLLPSFQNWNTKNTHIRTHRTVQTAGEINLWQIWTYCGGGGAGWKCEIHRPAYDFKCTAESHLTCFMYCIQTVLTRLRERKSICSAICLRSKWTSSQITLTTEEVNLRCRIYHQSALRIQVQNSQGVSCIGFLYSRVCSRRLRYWSPPHRCGSSAPELSCFSILTLEALSLTKPQKPPEAWFSFNPSWSGSSADWSKVSQCKRKDTPPKNIQLIILHL